MCEKKKAVISVIVATYNGKDFIERCINSVLSQTFSDFELIIVDDASDDGTWELLNDRYGNNGQIKLIRHEYNQGVSGARNTGLRAASGEYVALVDHDDFMEPRYLEVLYKTSQEYHSEYVLCGVRNVYPNGNRNTLFSAAHDAPGGMPSVRIACSLTSNLATWGKLISRKLIEDRDLRYMNGGIEDVYFNFRAMYYCNRYVSVPEILYNKCEHEGSLARSGLSMNYNYVRTLCEVLDRASDIIDEIGRRETLSIQDKDNIYHFFLFVSLANLRPLFHPKLRAKLFEALEEYLPKRFGRDTPYIRTFLLMNTSSDVELKRLKNENQQLREQISIMQKSNSII